jgi:hypothetical protein
MVKQEKPARSKCPSLKSTLLKLRDLMRERGLTESELIESYLVPQLSATKMILIQYKGEATEVFEVPDNASRLEAVEMCLQLLGAFPSRDPKDAEPQGVTVIIAPPNCLYVVFTERDRYIWRSANAVDN